MQLKMSCERFLFLEGIYLALKSHLQLRKVFRPKVWGCDPTTQWCWTQTFPALL